MEIRRARLEDLAGICTCCVEAFKDYITLIGRLPGPMLEDYGVALENDHLFVAVEEENIRGYLLIKDGDETFMWMDVLATHPQGNGVGQKLLDFCHAYILEQGKYECRLYTHVKYDRTREIYLKQGYQIYDRVKEHGFDRYYMKKELVTEWTREQATERLKKELEKGRRSGEEQNRLTLEEVREYFKLRTEEEND